jgi:hypothetical protein
MIRFVSVAECLISSSNFAVKIAINLYLQNRTFTFRLYNYSLEA